MKKPKTCTSCGETKEDKEFNKRGKSKDGLSYDCKKCHTKISVTWNKANPDNIRRNKRKWYKGNPDSIRNTYYKSRYGITLDEYNRMLIKQKGKCAICLETETSVNRITGLIKSLAIDHCHTTGKLRKLLCSDCNTGLGKFRESTRLLVKAICYLEVHT